MHPRSTDQPSQGELVFPLLETLANAGGAVRSNDVADALAEQFRLSELTRHKVVERRDGRIENLWQKHVRFAKEKAKSFGYVVSDKPHGKWQLTDAGFEGLSHSRPALLVEILRDAEGAPRAARINLAIGLPTTHLLVHGDASALTWIPDGSIPLAVTSCPYFDLRAYGSGSGQLSLLTTYEAFLDGMDAVLRECLRVLKPGGRIALNVGDVLRSRKRHGTHHVLPLSSDLVARSTRMGFHMLNGIVWHKRTNAAYEEGGSGVYGQPGQPNGVIRSECEQILFLRKPGPYWETSPAQRRDSMIPKDEYGKCFRAIWDDIPGASTKGGHPAPFPIELPRRLIQMFSFVGDTVLDPFGGSGTTSVAAAVLGRDSIYIDAERKYVRMAANRLLQAPRELAVA